MSSSPTAPVSSKKRDVVKSELESEPDTMTNTSPTSKKSKSAHIPPKSPSKGNSWSSERRLKLFEVYQDCSQVKWDEVAQKVRIQYILVWWSVERRCRWAVVCLPSSVGSSGRGALARKSERLSATRRIDAKGYLECGIGRREMWRRLQTTRMRCESASAKDKGYTMHGIQGGDDLLPSFDRLRE